MIGRNSGGERQSTQTRKYRNGSRTSEDDGTGRTGVELPPLPHRTKKTESRSNFRGTLSTLVSLATPTSFQPRTSPTLTRSWCTPGAGSFCAPVARVVHTKVPGLILGTWDTTQAVLCMTPDNKNGLKHEQVPLRAVECLLVEIHARHDGCPGGGTRDHA